MTFQCNIIGQWFEQITSIARLYWKMYLRILAKCFIMRGCATIHIGTTHIGTIRTETIKIGTIHIEAIHYRYIQLLLYHRKLFYSFNFLFIFIGHSFYDVYSHIICHIYQMYHMFKQKRNLRGSELLCGTKNLKRERQR
jgi:hypothetical protein